jgi:hypothetical protein
MMPIQKKFWYGTKILRSPLKNRRTGPTGQWRGIMVLEDLNTSTAWRTHVLLKTVFRVFMVEKKERVFHPTLLITKRTPTARAPARWWWH